MQLNGLQIQQLKNQGFSEREIAEAVTELDIESKTNALSQQYAEAQKNNIDPRMLSQQSMFAYTPQDNLIKYQLEINEILERAEHTLRDDELTYEKGAVIWKKNERSDRVFNDYGVKEIMKVLAIYINRNTLLGNYSHEEVNDIVFDFARELNDLIYMKYDLMGMDTPDKRKNYGMIVRMLTDLVRNAYSRAIGGIERESLHEARQVIQNDQTVQNQIGNQQGGSPEKRSIFNPMRYLVGKYRV